MNHWITNQKVPNELVPGMEHAIAYKQKQFPAFANTLTVEIDLTGIGFTALAKNIPQEIYGFNTITETEKMFVIAGRSYKKASFLRTILCKETFDKIEDICGTTGRMFLTIDPMWFSRASDYENFTSWSSCFSPNGCHRQSALIYAASPNIFMAMITNSDMTKMIGRRWVMIPSISATPNSPAKAIVFLKEYGTFPINYQRQLSRQMIAVLFGDIKKEWTLPTDNNRFDITSMISIPNHSCGNFNIDNSLADFNTYIWIDGVSFVANDLDKPLPYMEVTFEGIDAHYFGGGVETIGDDNDNEQEYYCENCDACINEDDMRHVNGNGNTQRWCEYCCANYAFYSSYYDDYILGNIEEEVWTPSGYTAVFKDDIRVSFWRIESSHESFIQAISEAEDEDEIISLLEDESEVNAVQEPRSSMSLELAGNRYYFVYDGEEFNYSSTITNRIANAIEKALERINGNNDEDNSEELQTSSQDVPNAG